MNKEKVIKREIQGNLIKETVDPGNGRTFLRWVNTPESQKQFREMVKKNEWDKINYTDRMN